MIPKFTKGHQMRIRLVVRSLLLVALMCLAVPAHAQEQAPKLRIPLKKARLPVGLLEGTVSDRSGAPLDAQVSVEETSGDSRKSYPVSVDPQTGAFEIRLPPGGYKVTAQASGYAGASINLEIRDRFRAKLPIKLQKAQEQAPAEAPESVAVRYDRDAQLGQEVNEADVTKIELEESIRYGATDTGVPTSGEALLKKLAALMNKDASLVRLIITGHSHKLGDEGLERRRSERRAVYVKNFLVNAGVDQARLRIEGKGARDPVASGSDEEARASNDRVNFVLWKAK